MENEREAQDSEEISTGEEKLLSRRNFLDGLGRWSKVVIGATVLGGSLITADHEANAGAGWANRGGGGGAAWANRGGGGGAAWANRGGGGGGAAWANRGAAWANRGSAWVNRY